MGQNTHKQLCLLLPLHPFAFVHHVPASLQRAPHNGVVHNIPGAELGQLLATQAGDVVDLDHLCMQLDLLACGVTGQVSGAALGWGTCRSVRRSRSLSLS
jgi:hypothetical protein